MAKSDNLSPTMKEALATVPVDWERLPHRSVLGGRTVQCILFDKTFNALHDRKLIEFKGGPGTWHWRKVDATRDPAVEAARDAREQIEVLEKERTLLNDRITAAQERLANIDIEITQLQTAISAGLSA